MKPIGSSKAKPLIVAWLEELALYLDTHTLEHRYENLSVSEKLVFGNLLDIEEDVLSEVEAEKVIKAVDTIIHLRATTTLSFFERTLQLIAICITGKEGMGWVDAKQFIVGVSSIDYAELLAEDVIRQVFPEGWVPWNEISLQRMTIRLQDAVEEAAKKFIADYSESINSYEHI